MRLRFYGLVALLVSAIGFNDQVSAQVVTDRTVQTTVTQPIVNQFEINGGMRSGNNLFHSFSQFSLPTNGSVIFNNATDIQTIFSRVTGSQLSNIDGILKTQGGANLFLMNPNGIIFGPNATLNLGGSFVGTTASAIKFEDGVEFNTINATPALLSVKVPIGLQMGTNPGAIQVTGEGHKLALVAAGFLPINRSQTSPGLQVIPGKTLALIGGEISLFGGILTAPGGHLEMASVSSGQITLMPSRQGWSLDYAPNTQFRDIRLSQKALIDVSGDGGSIQLRAQNILFSESSTALIQHTGSQRGGNVILNAADSITLVQSQPGAFTTRIESQTLGTGSTGEIQITAQKLNLQNGALINTVNYTLGGAGAMRFNISEAIHLFGAFPNDTSTNISGIGANGSRGASGDIFVSTKQLSLRDGGSIYSVTFGKGDSGAVIVNAKDSIDILGVKTNVLPSTIATSTLNTGNAGSLTINTARLTVQNGGKISSSTSARGNAGNLMINASESVTVSGIATDMIQRPSLIVASSLSAAPILQRLLGLPAIPTGNASNVIINTPQLSVSHGAQVGVDNIGSGNAGNLTIFGDRILLNDKGRLTASTASGEGGNITLNLRESFILRKNSRVDTQASGAGNGGNIIINSPIVLGLENSDIVANAVKGRGGNIQITTQGLFGLEYRDRLTSDNDITASSEFGINGNVIINTPGVDATAGSVTLPEDILAENIINDKCATNQGSKFVVTGRGGIKPSPSVQRSSLRSWSDIRTAQAAANSTPPIITALPTTPQILEADRFQIDPITGEVTLTASRSTPTELMTPATCSPNNLAP